MDERIKKLWANNKLLFLLLIPLIALVVFKDVIFAILANQVRGEVKDAVAKDDELKGQQNSALNESEKQKAKADAKEEEIDNREANSVSEDWNKNWRPKK